MIKFFLYSVLLIFGSISYANAASKKPVDIEIDRLEELDSNLWNHQETLKKQRFEKQAIELAKYTALTRIPKVLLRYCQNPCPPDLAKTAHYLSEFTRRLISTRLEKETASAAQVSTKDQREKICEICMGEIEQNDLENSVLLECGHLYHLNCLQEALNSYLQREEYKNLIACPHCSHQISPNQLASIVREADQALAIQRMLVRSLDCLKFCPSCGQGIACYNDHLKFAYECPNCLEDLCFSCGKPPHPTISCEELAANEGVQKAFIREILKQREGESYGLCPHCKILVERSDGCSKMICGQNTEEKERIQFKEEGVLGKSTGCGKNFDWKLRIKLADGENSQIFNSTGIDLPSSASAAVQARQIQNTALPPLLQPNDPYYVRWFEELGPMYRITDPTGQVADFTLSSPSHNRMYLRDVTGWSEEVRNSSSRHTEYHSGFCAEHYASTPTREQYEALIRALSVTGRYIPLPGMEGKLFWSSVDPHNVSRVYFLIGTSGMIFNGFQGNYAYVMCVR